LLKFYFTVFAPTYFATAVSYGRKMFIKLPPGCTCMACHRCGRACACGTTAGRWM